LVHTGEWDLGSSGGQYFKPFPANQWEYPLPVNSAWGDEFKPSYVTTDYALSENADVFVIMGYAVLYDNWQYERQSYHGLCNNFDQNVTDRYGYSHKECRYNRVTTYTQAGNGYWNHEPVGRPIESMTSGHKSETAGPATVVALSAAGTYCRPR
ncbi:hypothetical protein THAOC_01684, partial [Thalassiosira oceanica]